MLPKHNFLGIRELSLVMVAGGAVVVNEIWEGAKILQPILMEEGQSFLAYFEEVKAGGGGGGGGDRFIFNALFTQFCLRKSYIFVL